MRIGHASHRQHSGRSSQKEEDVASLDSRTGLVARIIGCRLDSRTAVHGAEGAVPGVPRGLSGVAGGMVFVNQMTAFSCGEGLRCA
jgi:hypothetical protein